MIKDFGVISNFQFSSDHRPVLCKFGPISPHHNTKISENNLNKQIPVHKRQEAADLLFQILKEIKWDEFSSGSLRDNYNFLMEAIQNVTESLGTP